jgi:hypothetical protein
MADGFLNLSFQLVCRAFDFIFGAIVHVGLLTLIIVPAAIGWPNPNHGAVKILIAW